MKTLILPLIIVSLFAACSSPSTSSKYDFSNNKGTVPDYSEYGEQALKTNIFSFDEVQEKPVLLEKPEKEYPLEAKGATGYVTFEYVVNVDGSVSDVYVRHSSHYAFTNRGTEFVSRLKYSPGKINGRAVMTRVVQTVKYDPRKRYTPESEV